MHIKTIKGKKYWYTSKRVDGKVTSVYIGPVDSTKKLQDNEEEPEKSEEEETSDEESFYVG